MNFNTNDSLHDKVQDLYGKVQDLLLSRIEKLEWTYFEFDLREIDPKSPFCHNEAEIKDFLDSITPNYFGRYKSKIEYSQKDILRYILTLLRAYPQLFNVVMHRLFDMNAIQNLSSSDLHLMGKFNRKEQEARNKIYRERINNKHRDLKEGVVILAEGDSWFQFPRVYLSIDPIKDIVDWLIDDEKYAVYNLASGGDWLSNIFHSGEYIEELPKVSPDVFMLSGGGNDLVGDNRLATMVINPKLEGRRDLESGYLQRLVQKRSNDSQIKIDTYKRGLSLLSDEFFSLMNLYFIQYLVYLFQLSVLPQYQNMLMITHGYDYALPTNEKRGSWISVQRIITKFLDSGTWLFQPLNMKGITKEVDQDAVLYAMIYEFNEMLISLAEWKGLPNFVHIDCRGFAKEDDWFDELHVKSHVYKEIANVYKYVITQRLFNGKAKDQNVFRVLDYVRQS